MLIEEEKERESLGGARSLGNFQKGFKLVNK